jgi:hypothetical protein
VAFVTAGECARGELSRALRPLQYADLETVQVDRVRHAVEFVRYGAAASLRTLNRMTAPALRAESGQEPAARTIDHAEPDLGSAQPSACAGRPAQAFVVRRLRHL